MASRAAGKSQTEVAARTLCEARRVLRWAGGRASALKHLRKRIERHELPPRTTLEAFERRVSRIVTSNDATVYFDPDANPPLVLVGFKMTTVWIVLLSTANPGAVVTSFPPSRGWRYFETHKRLGRASEVMTWLPEDE